MLLLVALGFSCRLAWINRDAPQFGFLHDDGLYLVSAKSLAEGSGYRLENLPGSPPHTKYPPAYPLFLTLAWHLGGGYPGCLPWATLFGWLTIPLLAGLSLLLFREYHFKGWRLAALGTALLINPYMNLFGVNLLSESLFLCLLLASFLLAARTHTSRGAFAAGLAAAVAFLTRSAGLVLLVSTPIAYWYKGSRSRAAWFTLAMAPAVAAWMLWSRLHIPPPGPDWIVAYYTNYLSYQLQNAPLSILHIVLWKNLDGLLYSMGSLLFPKVFDLLPAKIAADVIALAMIAGVIRLVRRVEAARQYALFAAGSVGLLLIWHFPPTERFLLPLAPLLFAGLLTEFDHIASLVRVGLRHKDRSQRVAAAAIASLAVAFLIACAALQIWVAQFYSLETAQQWRDRRVERQPAYEWIRTHTSADAVFVAYDDGPLYLETGRHAFAVPLPTRYWYLEDFAHQVDVYRHIDTLARHHGAKYVFYSTNDLDRDAAPDQRSAVEQVMRDNRQLRAIWSGGRSIIYEVTP